MSLDPLCPDPATWRIAVIAPEQDRLVLHLQPLRQAVPFPVGDTRSHRMHSRYRRTPWDVPWGRWPVQLVVHARRFFCEAPTCPWRCWPPCSRMSNAAYEAFMDFYQFSGAWW
jgi:hypothetical protein